MPRVRLIVRGLVQGVGFRWFVASRARALGLTGWVRNRTDGAVETEAEGSREALSAFVTDVARGPSHARVSEVEQDWEETPGGHREFVIRD
jgi:acylphosphatase